VRARSLRERGPTLVVAALLVVTAAAFVWTERQKLQPPPFAVREVTETFSPVCGCDLDEARIVLELRPRTRLTLAIVDEDGSVVRPLVADLQRRGRVVLRWDGRDANGNVVPDGTYRPRVRIRGNARTFVLPNPMLVDATPPQATLVRVRTKEVDARARGSRVALFYRLSEAAQPLLFVNGRIRVQGRVRRRGKLDWYPRVRGVPMRRGRYELELAARDLAGNIGPRTRAVVVRLR